MPPSVVFPQKGSSKKGNTGARAAILGLAKDDEERSKDENERVGEGHTTPTSLERLYHFITVDQGYGCWN